MYGKPCCGTNTDGQEVIYGYQLNVEPNKWAIFELNKISGLGLYGQYFSRARDGFNPDKIGFTNIICKINTNLKLNNMVDETVPSTGFLKTENIM